MGRQIGDFTLEELRKYKPALANKPDQFSEFWNEQKDSLQKYTTSG